MQKPLRSTRRRFFRGTLIEFKSYNSAHARHNSTTLSASKTVIVLFSVFSFERLTTWSLQNDFESLAT